MMQYIKDQTSKKKRSLVQLLFHSSIILLLLILPHSNVIAFTPSSFSFSIQNKPFVQKAGHYQKQTSTTTTPTTSHTTTHLNYKNHEHEEDKNNNNNEQNKNNTFLSKSLQTRTSPLHFLTQRSIQSFMFLLKECRDPHTANWIECYSQSSNLLGYHGTGGLDFTLFPEWDSYLNGMMKEDPDVVVVKISRDLGGGGLSKNNPYREKEESVREIEIDIDPPSLAGRLLSIREKISREWVEDLDLVSAANDAIMSSYTKRQKDARDQERESERREQQEEQGHDDDDSSSTSSDGGDKKMMKKESFGSLSPSSSKKEGSDTSTTSSTTGATGGEAGYGGSFGTTRSTQNDNTFERLEMYLLSNHPNMNDMHSSPVRASSFDLLFLLSTQEAIHRVLDTYMKHGESKIVFFEWFKTYYTTHVSTYFDGNQNYGRADDFLDDLLRTPPSLINKDDKVGFVDPLAIAEDIIRVRGEVIKDWKVLMKNVIEDHTELRRELFVRQMAKWGQPVVQQQEEEEDVVVVEEVKKVEEGVVAVVVVEEEKELVLFEEGLDTAWE